MNILYICPNFPPNYRRFPVRLKEQGATVAGIGWEPLDRLRPEVRQSLAEYCHVPDMGNYDHVLRAAGCLVSRVGRLDRVFSQEEHWIDLEAALRLDFNVPGWKPRDILPVRLKSLMKGVFRGAAVPVAQGEPAADPAGARRLAGSAGYPLIAKPDKGVGAHATFRIDDDAGLERFFAKKDPAVPYIIEEFLEGDIQSFDGLTDPEGRIVFSASHQFSIGIMAAVNENRHLHYWSLREIPADLEDFGRKAVAAFGLRERFFHIEFIRSPRGDLRAMEINARPPGGLTTDMFNYANDIDIYLEWARTVTGGRFEARAERPYHVSYIGRKNIRRYAHSHEEVLRRHGALIVMHTAIDSVFRGAIGDYAYLARATDMDALRPVVEFIQEEA
ncbi:MAG: ATP-grasp domain-containing protein [Elusimicrobia bacterium]|nr:ATP-grasp domain-containing protein [Elusimicrobiota bacterium]